MISRNMISVFSAIIAITVGSTLLTSSVVAAKPNFSSTPTIVKNSDLSITANFKAKALGKKVTDVYLSSLTNAQLGCVNPGGHLSPSQTKRGGFEQSQNQTIELKPKNGIIKGSLTLRQPTLPSGAEICPNKNWSADLLSLIYQNVQLHIQRKNSDILTFDFGNISAISTATIQ